MATDTFLTQLKSNYQVKTHDVDMHQEMKIPEIMNLLQELATQHADLLNFGYDHLLKKNQFWVLSRLRLEMSHVPKWKHTLNCVTWTNGLDGIFPLRNWQLFDNAKLMLAGYAQWLILDGTTHRPVRPDTSDFDGKIFKQRATQHSTKKLKPFNNSSLLAEYSVRLHELDMNGHVNNVFYFAWILDSLGLAFYGTQQVYAIDINYLKEITYPAHIKVYSNTDKTQFKLTSEEDKTLHALINIEWIKR